MAGWAPSAIVLIALNPSNEGCWATRRNEKITVRLEGEEHGVHIRLRTPDLTEELVRFLGRMGFRAREIDYGLVEVEPGIELDESHLAGYLRIWQRVHARATAELEFVPAR